MLLASRSARVVLSLGGGAALVALYISWRRLTAAAAAKPLILFDVDGTLAVPAQKAPEQVLELLATLRARGYLVGIVGAGDFEKQQGQLGGPDLRERLDYCFSENGVHAFCGTRLLHCKSIVDQLGAARWAEFEAGLAALQASVHDEAEALLRQACGDPAATLDARGTFLERRQCTVNVCIIGRTPGLTREQRATFEELDRSAGLRVRVLGELLRLFGPETPYRLMFTIGGQIGIDCAPCGWDKTFCLNFLPLRQFPMIHFFGDKTLPGGGDFELYEHARTFGHAVGSPEDTISEVRRLFL